jgi:hypothetical protein
MMHGHEKSDSVIVAAKPANCGAGAGASRLNDLMPWKWATDAAIKRAA